MKKTAAVPTLGIMVGGGPAPGINGVISAATIEGVQSNMRVIGIYDGFQWLIQGDTSHILELGIQDVSRIHFEGGSILRTSRANPTKSEEAMKQVLASLRKLGITHLITIGGDDTALSASELHRYAHGVIKMAHVPKTIDNDIPLPGNMPTFGFNTARHVGTQIVQNLMEDAKTTNRWYFVVVMGRQAGHLAVGIAKAAGAHLALIGEEFRKRPILMEDACRVLEGAIIKRRALNANHGVAVVAEGIAEILDPEELQHIPGVELEYDDHNRLRIAEVPLATLLKKQVRKDLLARKDKTTVVDVTLGYELRCAPPIPFDCEYVRDLGYAAVRYLLEDAGFTDEGGALVCSYGGERYLIPFHHLREESKKRIKIRMVDLTSQYYEVAYKYMIRLKNEDFEPQNIPRLAEAAGMTPEAFVERFGHLENPITGEPLAAGRPWHGKSK